MPKCILSFLSPNSQAKEAFSLIELLVAIAVIGVLLALIISAVSSAKVRANQATGASIMRNIGSAVLLYANENSGRLPGPLFSNQVAIKGSTRDGSLINWIAPYLGAEDVEIGGIVHGYANPALKNHVKDWKTVSHYYLIHHPRSASGSWQTGIQLWGGHPSGSGNPLYLAGVEDPGKQIILLDSDSKLVRGEDFPPGLPPPDVTFEPVYRNSRNMLYMDGRVDNIKLH
jgi:prepilin-type N-terminal cleavage/methylation domain-containing protein